MRNTRCLTWLRSKPELADADAIRAKFSGRYPASAAAPARAAPVARNRRRDTFACHGLLPKESVRWSVTRKPHLCRSRCRPKLVKARAHWVPATGPGAEPDWASPRTAAALLLEVSAM